MILKQSVNIRDEFNFSEVFLKLTQRVTCQVTGVMLTLHETHCVYNSMNLKKKITFISNIYTFFLYHIRSLFVNFRYKEC